MPLFLTSLAPQPKLRLSELTALQVKGPGQQSSPLPLAFVTLALLELEFVTWTQGVTAGLGKRMGILISSLCSSLSISGEQLSKRWVEAGQILTRMLKEQRQKSG